MTETENTNLEYKCEFTNDIKNTVIAFANTQGGIIKIGIEDNGEICGVVNKELTFNYAIDEFKERDIPFNESKYITLGIMRGDKTFSNLGLLISDQCQHTIKIAVFDGVEKRVFIDRKEFGGSLLKQLNDAYNYLTLNNKTHATFSEINRIDSSDYSGIVIREALVNAIVHRDYGFSGSIIVNVYENRMEFISLGGLVGGLSEKDILSGISQTRNEKLANIFYRLKHIETYGYGLPNIFSDYRESNLQPEIKVTDNTFVITIPNKNYNLYVFKEEDAKIYSIPYRITENEKFVINYIKSNGFITREIIEKELKLKQSRAYQIIRKMKDVKLISVSNNDKKRFILSAERKSFEKSNDK
ncbi:MAG: ATP-binding protein [Saccharofermentanales bacterium]